MKLGGPHHVSSLTARLRDNQTFCPGVLVRCLRKRNVNQNAPTMGHPGDAGVACVVGSHLTLIRAGPRRSAEIPKHLSTALRSLQM